MALQDTPGSADTNVVQFRIERGAAAMGTDGLLGTVEQIVVDRDSGVLRALIVSSADGGAEFELPADHIQRAVGDSVYLDIGRADLATHPDLATPYDPDQYVPVYQGETTPAGQASRRALDTEHPVITDVEENAAELVAPEMTVAPTPAAGATSTAPSATQGTASVPPLATDAAAESMSTTWVPRRGASETGQVASAASSPSPAADDTVTGSTGKLASTDEMAADATSPSEPGATDAGVPPQTVSARPAVTGPLIGGKPTTSGMGTKSAVPRSDEPPYDNPPTPPSTPVAPPSPGMIQAFSEAGSEPAFASPADRQEITDAVEVEGVDISTDMPSPTEETMAANVSADTLNQDTLEEELTGSAAAPEVGAMPTSMPNAVSDASLAEQPVPLSEPQSWGDQSFVARMQEKLPAAAALPTLVLAAGGLGVGITAIVLRQRQAAHRLARQQQAAATAQDVKQSLLQVTEQARQGMQQAKATSKRAVNQAKATASHAAEQTKVNASVAADQAKKSTKATTYEAKRTVKRTARRARWFRRGMLLGSGVAILFAPQPGTQLREQIAGAVEQLRAKIA